MRSKHGACFRLPSVRGTARTPSTSILDTGVHAVKLVLRWTRPSGGLSRPCGLLSLSLPRAVKPVRRYKRLGARPLKGGERSRAPHPRGREDPHGPWVASQTRVGSVPVRPSEHQVTGWAKQLSRDASVTPRPVSVPFRFCVKGAHTDVERGQPRSDPGGAGPARGSVRCELGVVGGQ